MKTIEIPDDLYREVAEKSALQGRSISDVVVEVFGTWVREMAHAQDEEPSAGDLMVDLCGSIDSGVSDLSTNPAYLEELGRAAARDR